MKNTITFTLIIFLFISLVPLISINGKSCSEQVYQSNTIQTSINKISKHQEQNTPQNTFKIFDKSNNSIIEVSEKDFIYSIVATEMSPSFCDESLKAQAVASYTYFCNQKQNSNDEFDFSIDQFLSEEYFKERWGDNFNLYFNKIKENVDCVFGQVIQSNGDIILAAYHAISSGHTEASKDVFGGERTYLIPVESPGDLLAPNYKTSVEFSKDEFYSLITQQWPDITLCDDASKWISQIEKTDSGMVKSVKIGDIYTNGTILRRIFCLRSACFDIDLTNDLFTFTVFGYGHGVGMSQCGADYMASQGYSYKEILSWYYPGTTIAYI